ncbi:MAG: hypothetical protein WDO24_18120 [Pseudomonadota bacterium]
MVASEVKALANQTSRATGEIATQVGEVQEATKSAVGAIEAIRAKIGELSQIASMIAASVEEQGAATQEISRNVQEAARGTQEVSSNITAVKEAATQTGAAAEQVLGSSASSPRRPISCRAKSATSSPASRRPDYGCGGPPGCG